MSMWQDVANNDWLWPSFDVFLRCLKCTFYRCSWFFIECSMFDSFPWIRKHEWIMFVCFCFHKFWEILIKTPLNMDNMGDKASTLFSMLSSITERKKEIFTSFNQFCLRKTWRKLHYEKKKTILTNNPIYNCKLRVRNSNKSALLFIVCSRTIYFHLELLLPIKKKMV